MSTSSRLLLNALVAVIATTLSSGARSAPSSAPAVDTLYRCTEGPSTRYQAEPCAGGRTLALDPAPSPGQRAEAQALAQKEAEWVAKAAAERQRREAAHLLRQQQLAAAGPAGVRLRPDPWAADVPQPTSMKKASGHPAHRTKKGKAHPTTPRLTPGGRKEWVGRAEQADT